MVESRQLQLHSDNWRRLFPVNVIESSTCLSPRRDVSLRVAAYLAVSLAPLLLTADLVAHAEHFLQLETTFQRAT